MSARYNTLAIACAIGGTIRTEAIEAIRAEGVVQNLEAWVTRADAGVTSKRQATKGRAFKAAVRKAAK